MTDTIPSPVELRQPGAPAGVSAPRDSAARPVRRAIGSRVRFRVLRRDGFTCRYCGRRPPDVVLHIDHVVAVANGGTNDERNLITACALCNMGKATMPARLSIHEREAVLYEALCDAAAALYVMAESASGEPYHSKWVEAADSARLALERLDNQQ